MCDPLTIAGLALTAGSTVATYSANQQVEAARNDALAAERIRQNTLNRESDAINLTSQDRYQDFEGQQEAAATQLGDYFTEQSVPEPEVGSALPSSTSNIVVQEEARQRGQARDFTNRTGAALGELRAFGDVLGGISRDQARDASLIGQIGGFKAGSSGVLPFELDEANSAGDGMKLFGDILGGLGSISTGAGLSGASLPGSVTRALPGWAGGTGVGKGLTGAATYGGNLGAGFIPGLNGGLRLGSLYGAR